MQVYFVKTWVAIKANLLSSEISFSLTMDRADVAILTVSELSGLLLSKLEEKVDHPELVACNFEEHKITGELFLNLTSDELREIILTIGDRRAVQNILSLYQQSNDTDKVRNLYDCAS